MYLDPSFGGMLLQILVAIIAGGGAIAFGMRRNIKALFKKKDKLSQSPANEDKYSAGNDVVDMMEDIDGK